MVAEDYFGASGHIFEADLGFLLHQMFRHIGDIASSLFREAGKRRAFRFCLDDATQLSANEETVVNRARLGLKFPNRYAKASAKVHVAFRLDQPTACGKAAIN